MRAALAFNELRSLKQADRKIAGSVLISEHLNENIYFVWRRVKNKGSNGTLTILPSFLCQLVARFSEFLYMRNITLYILLYVYRPVRQHSCFPSCDIFKLYFFFCVRTKILQSFLVSTTWRFQRKV